MIMHAAVAARRYFASTRCSLLGRGQLSLGLAMYNQLAEIPVPTGAQFMTRHDVLGPTVVQASYSVKDHARNTKRPMAKSLVFSPPPSLSLASASASASSNQEQFQSTLAKTPLEDAPETIWQIVSASGKKRAILRKSAAGSKDGSAARFVDIWKDGLLEASLDVTGLHGEFYADEFLGALAFAPSESALVYVAELKAPDAKDPDPYRKYRFNPDFGEGLAGKKSPAIFILRWSAQAGSPTLYQLNTASVDRADVRFGQPIFDPNSDEVIYATGYEFTQDGRVLGIKGCFNRPSGIWRLKFPVSPARGLVGDAEEPPNPVVLDLELAQKLTPSQLSCRSPRVLTYAGKSKLVWLSGATGGAHVATSSLHILDISGSIDDHSLASSDTPLVGIITTPLKDLNVFPGLYPAYNIPFSPFIFANTKSESEPDLLLHSHWGSRTTVLRISLKDGSVQELTPDTEGKLYSWAVLATDGRDSVICTRSSSGVPYEIVLGRIGKGANGVEWYLLDRPDVSEEVAETLESIKTRIIRIPGHDLLETIAIHSEKTKSEKGLPPCITTAHGGPHGAITTAFSPSTTALALEGYTMSLPNYTGSPGYGEAFLQGVIGKCGDVDVAEIMAVAKHLIAAGISEEGPGAQFIIGGSHGGFLTAHLIGRFPTFFSAAVLRNPVISVGDVSSTDIPDWYFSEFGLDYPLCSSPRFSFSSNQPQNTEPPAAPPPLMTAETYKILEKASPIRYIDGVDVPVLLLIGKSDRRVTPSQGTEYYHALKARYAAKEREGLNEVSSIGRRKVEMLAFEGESHPLEGVEASRVVFEATRDWLAQVRK